MGYPELIWEVLSSGPLPPGPATVPAAADGGRGLVTPIQRRSTGATEVSLNDLPDPEDDGGPAALTTYPW